MQKPSAQNSVKTCLWDYLASRYFSKLTCYHMPSVQIRTSPFKSSRAWCLFKMHCSVSTGAGNRKAEPCQREMSAFTTQLSLPSLFFCPCQLVCKLKFVQQVCLGKNDTRLPRGVFFFFFFLFQDLEKSAGKKITNKNQSDLICQMHLVEMNLSLLHL